MSSKPNVLIFGGTSTVTPHIVQYLVPHSGDAKVGSIQVFDKYSIHPPTTYLGAPYKQLLEEKKDIITYTQVNLTNPSVVTTCFSTAPLNGGKWTHIIDATGEITFDRPAEIQVNQTLKVALSLAHAAISPSHASTIDLQAYIRPTYPFYDHSGSSEKGIREEDENGWKPHGIRGIWWHETLRALGAIEALPLVVTRLAYLYGRNVISTEVTVVPALIFVGYAYKRIDEEMKYLWGSKLRKHTINADDAAGAIWACAEWMAKVGKEEASAKAGVVLPPSGDKSIKDVPEAIQKDKGGVRVVAFNLADETDTNQDILGKTIAEVYGIKFGFQNIIHSQLAQFKMTDVAEEINEMHLEGWSQILIESNPPVPSTPLSPYAFVYQLEKYGFSGDGSKLRAITGYQLTRGKFDVATVKEMIESFRKEGTWPETPLYQG